MNRRNNNYSTREPNKEGQLIFAEENTLHLTEKQIGEKELCLAEETIGEDELYLAKKVMTEEQAVPYGLRKQVPSIMSSFNPSTWKIMIVDDEQEIHEVTRFALDDLVFYGRSLTFISAYSAKEAKSLLLHHPDVALIFLDVVMESDDAGLQLVDFIRHEIDNGQMRLIIRTGQPGLAPERYVIEHYDIDDYKDKTELTANKLYSTLRTALKVYRDLMVIEANRQGLEKILNAVPDIYRIQPVKQFLEGILTQITNLCALGKNILISSFGSIEFERQDSVIRAGIGKFSDSIHSLMQVETTIRMCEDILRGTVSKEILPKHSFLFPMKLGDEILGFVYLEDVSFLEEEDRYLLRIMLAQCAAALKNLKLYSDLGKAHEQNHRKTQFLGMAAHDLRNPLGAIAGYIELLQEEIGVPDQKQLEYLNGIQEVISFMLNLIDNFLNVAKIEAGKLDLERKLTDLVSVVRKSILFNRLLAETKHIQLEFSCHEKIPSVMLDTDKVQQVVNNLISNAIKYSHSHTTVHITVARNDEFLSVSVKDEGQGIPQDELNKLFQAFSKTSIVSTAGESSTGLGLLICRQIVEAHQGKIWVESQSGVGSVFYVSFPLSTI